MEKQFYHHKSSLDHKCGIKVLILAGVHGNELGTILLARDINKWATPKNLADNGIATLDIWTDINFSGTRNKTREYVANDPGMDLNRGYSIDRPSADDIRKEIIDLISKNNYEIVIDMHCSPNLAPMFLIDANQDYAPEICEWCDKHHLNCMVRECCSDTIKRFVSNYCDSIGMTWEQPGMNDSLNYNSENRRYLFKHWINEIIPNLKYLRNKVSNCPHKRAKNSNDENLIDILEFCEVRKNYRLIPNSHKAYIIPSGYQGIFIPSENVSNGSRVEETTVIGHIVTDDGYEIEVVPEVEGVIQIIRGLCYVVEYETLAFITPIHEGEVL